MNDLIRGVERAIAAEAQAHARAVLELNPYSEASSLELGDGVAVYAGVASPWNAFFGDCSSLEPRDWEEVLKFFRERDAAPVAWSSEIFPIPGTKQESMLVYAQALTPGEQSETSLPSPETWPLLFTKSRRAAATAPDLLAMIKFHQRETRFYSDEQSASYTFFQNAVAWVPFPGSLELLDQQKREAASFGCKFFATTTPGFVPLAYERSLYAF